MILEECMRSQRRATEDQLLSWGWRSEGSKEVKSRHKTRPQEIPCLVTSSSPASLLMFFPVFVPFFTLKKVPWASPSSSSQSSSSLLLFMDVPLILCLGSSSASFSCLLPFNSLPQSVFFLVFFFSSFMSLLPSDKTWTETQTLLRCFQRMQVWSSFISFSPDKNLLFNLDPCVKFSFSNFTFSMKPLFSSCL